MDTEFEYLGCRVYVRVRELSGEVLGFTTGLWRANVTVQPQDADYEEVADGIAFPDPKSATADGEARGRAFIHALTASKGDKR